MEVLKERSPVKGKMKKSLETEPLLRTNSAGFLVCRDEEQKEVAVTIRLCFPWAEPLRHFSLRDKENQEVLFVRDLTELDKKSQRALTQALHESGFFFVIERIDEISEDFELRSWRVQTKQGARRFQTGLTAWPRQLADGSLVVQDVYGDVYVIPSPRSLRAKDQKLLAAFVD